MTLRETLRIMAIWQTLVQLLVPSMMANAQCNLSQYMEIGQAYYIYNPEYPYNYKGGTSCRWYATSPLNSKIYFSCEEVNIPQSESCYLERLSVSLSGNQQLADAQNFCGNGTLSLVSNSNAMAIGLTAEYYARGGRLMCTITAIANTPTTTERPALCDCGQRFEKRIVGGVETGINEFPFMAAIYEITKKEVLCGSTIISKRYAITAAHCIFDTNTFTANTVLVVGDHDISTGDDTASAAVYRFERFQIHEQYNARQKTNDIAILRVNLDIQFSDRVGVVCLPFKLTKNDLTGATLTLAGWGLLEFTGMSPTKLQKVDVQVQSVNQCRSNVTGEIILDSQLCTYTPGKDACQFDSGGPALYENRSIRRLFLSGIISYGKACAANEFAVNTRVTSYLEWIVKHTGDTNYCIR